MQVQFEPSQGLASYPFNPGPLPARHTTSSRRQRGSNPRIQPSREPSPFARCHGGLAAAGLARALRTALDAETQAIRDELEAGGDALWAIRRRSELIDGLIRHLLQLARQRSPVAASRLAVAAVGGYGRGELAPHSDIDLLFLVPKRAHDQDIRTIEFVLYALWDVGLQVGHAVRSVRDCVKLAKSDWKTATSLLDLRFVAGRRALYDELAHDFDAAVERKRDTFARTLVDDWAARQSRFAKTETPDVKRGPGGLRDAQTILWLARLHGRPATADGLDGRTLGTSELRDYLAALDLLWSVRCHLHHLVGRAEERLGPDLLTEVASRTLGRNADRGGATDAFLRRWSEATHCVSTLCAQFCASTMMEGKIS